MVFNLLKLGYEINGFLKNYSGTEIILNHELLLMEQLNFHIKVVQYYFCTGVIFQESIHFISYFKKPYFSQEIRLFVKIFEIDHVFTIFQMKVMRF